MTRRLSTRSTSRALVIASTFVWLLFISPIPRSLDGAGMPLALLLLALDLVMASSVGWLAFARTASLDERQAALRDRAYRIAFRLILVGVIVMIVAVFVGSLIASAGPDPTMTQTPVVFGGRWIVGLLELLVATPTAVITWLLPGSLHETDLPSEVRSGARRWLPLAAVLLLAALWLLTIAATPVRVSSVISDPFHGSMSGATCGHFSTSRAIGYGFGAEVRLDVQPCWDANHAFDYPGIPLAERERCSVDPGTAEFARVTKTCAERTDADGTLHYSVHATILAGLFPPVTRDVTLELEVTKDGKVVVVG
jgi:hypothetical protein